MYILLIMKEQRNQEVDMAKVLEVASFVGTGTDVYRLRIGTRTLEHATRGFVRRGVAGL